MQVDASDAFDIQQESAGIHELYGTQPGKESFANNCLLARRLAERGVRYIQLFDWGWDSHGAGENEALNGGFKDKCTSVDRPLMALISDLKQRGLLDETLIVWSGEFGRTPMRENRNGVEMKFVGRDHNPGAFTLWLAGGGVKPGFSYGETDEFGYQSVIDKVSVHDLHATMLHLLGYDHLKFSYPVSGVNMRLTNVTKPGSRVVQSVVA
jgi:arylsulfatase A-like enzyme